MECPQCNSDMMDGELYFHGTILTAILIGMSYENLYFKSKKTPDEEILLIENTEKKSGHYCSKCQIICFEGISNPLHLQ